jgi:hypothetical protein
MSILRRCQLGKGEVRGVSRRESEGGLRITVKLRFTRATRRGVQRGEAPLRFFSSPKNGGGGLKLSTKTLPTDFALLYPPYNCSPGPPGDDEAWPSENRRGFPPPRE